MRARDSYLNSRLTGFTSTIFAEMSALAESTGSINLGQGFPDTDGPSEVAEAAIDAIRSGYNQYPPGAGILPLREAIASHQRAYYGLDYAPDDEVLVTAGATEALAATIISLCDSGDEIILFEPYYDAYAAIVAIAGATRRTVSLRGPSWSFDEADLRAAVGPRTRAILVNTPNNPTGKVFSVEELAVIAAVCLEFDLVAITDEVYEHLVFDSSHIPLATLPGMWERTVTISSAAKSFSFTGWKIGWACASRPLTAAVRASKQFLTYVNGAPFQHAITVALNDTERFVTPIRRDLEDQMVVLTEGLRSIGLSCRRPQGTYFVMTDVREIGYDDGYRFCLDLPKRAGVVAVPASVFFDDREAGAPLVRWTFCKRPSVLDEAVARLTHAGFEARTAGEGGSDEHG